MLVSAFEIRRHDHERQHYRLYVTNLEARDYEYAIEFHGEQSSGATHGFASLARISLVVDEPLRDDGLLFVRSPNVFAPSGALRRFVIPAQRTALLELYPPGPNRGDARGYVVLRLPTNSQASTGRLTYSPQSDQPVRVLLQAESHITRVPETFFAGGTNVALAQSDGMTHPYAIDVSLASGKAENLLDPDGVFRIKDIEHVTIRDVLDQISAASYSGAETIPDVNRLATLLELLAQLHTDQLTVTTVNRLLTDGGVTLRLC